MIKKIALTCFLSFALLVAYSSIANAKRAIYTGNLGCKCHKPNQDDWAKSRHGLAFQTLVLKGRTKYVSDALAKLKLDPGKDYSTDKICLQCHTVGFEEPGGYEDADSSEDLRGVGCENCHGPGSEYRFIHKKKGDDEGNLYTRAEVKAAGQIFPMEDSQICKKCHDNPDAATFVKGKFKYEESIKHVKEWHKTNKLQFKHD